MSTAKKKNKKDTTTPKSTTTKTPLSTDAVEEDGSPVLDEKDLEENHLTVEEADNIVWDNQEPMEDLANSKKDNGKEE